MSDDRAGCMIWFWARWPQGKCEMGSLAVVLVEILNDHERKVVFTADERLKPGASAYRDWQQRE